MPTRQAWVLGSPLCAAPPGPHGLRMEGWFTGHWSTRKQGSTAVEAKQMSGPETQAMIPVSTPPCGK